MTGQPQSLTVRLLRTPPSKPSDEETTLGESPEGDSAADQTKFWREDLPIQLMQATRELRAALRIDESMFVSLAPPDQPHARDFVLAHALDEVQRTAIAMIRWNEFIGDGSPTAKRADAPPELDRVILERCPG